MGAGRPGATAPITDGRTALDLHAPDVSAALDTTGAAVWAAAAAHDAVDLLDLIARVMGRAHDLEPLDRPGVAGPSPWIDRVPDDWRSFPDLTERERTVLAFAEQFSIDVSSLAPSDREAVLEALGPAAGDLVQAMWVLDFLPRVRAALDALFGPSTWLPPDVEPTADSLWLSIDAFIRSVPALEALDPVTSELVRLRGARQHQCRLCQSLRSRPALLAGAGDDDFAAVDDYATSHLPADRKAALALTDALIWLPGRIDSAVAAAVRRNFDDARCVELVIDVARNATNKIAVAFGADAPHVEEGFEIYEILPDGEALYGLTLD